MSPEVPLESQIICQCNFIKDVHLQKWICTGNKEDDARKEEDEDINENKEVKIVLVGAKNLETDEF